MRGSDGKERQVATLSAGSYVGELTAFTGKSQSATVVVTEEARLLELSEEHLENVVQTYPSVRHTLEACARNNSKEFILGHEHIVHASYS